MQRERVWFGFGVFGCARTTWCRAPQADVANDSSERLHEYHEDQLLKYLRFIKRKREQSIHDAGHAFEDVIDSRLVDSSRTYTSDEVRKLVADVADVVTGDIAEDLVNFSHMNVLLLKQLFLKAQNWHLNLTADVSQMENEGLLREIARFEEDHINRIGRSGNKVMPLFQRPDDKLLTGEIERLKRENEELKSSLAQCAVSAGAALKAKNVLMAKLTTAEAAATADATSSETAPAMVRADDADDDEAAELTNQLKASQVRCAPIMAAVFTGPRGCSAKWYSSRSRLQRSRSNSMPRCPRRPRYKTCAK